jgi:hypothetical protein
LGRIQEAVIFRAAEGLDTLFVTDDIIAEIENTVQKPKFENRQEQIGAIMPIVDNLIHQGIRYGRVIIKRFVYRVLACVAFVRRCRFGYRH